MQSLSKKEKKRLLKYWKTALCLDDWTICLRDGVYPNELLPNSQGQNEYDIIKKIAVISIINEDCYSKEHIQPYDWEIILVHELCHSYFAILDDTDDVLQNRIIHQMVEDISQALVRARRSNPNGSNTITKNAQKNSANK